MNRQHFAFVLALGLTLTAVSAVAQAPLAKTSAPDKKQTWKTPRTEDGQPDLQGVWANNNATPLERPKALEGRAFLTDEELAAFKKKAGELFGPDSDAAFGDGIFEAVLASVKQSQSGPHKKAVDELDFGTGDYSSVWIVGRKRKGCGQK